MKKTHFRREASRATVMREADPDNQHYWMGYLRGLRRRYHGEDFGTEDEHQLWLTATGDVVREQRSAGYRDGYYGPVDWDDLPTSVRTIQSWRGIDAIAEYCGVSTRTVNGWVQGRNISPAALKLLKLFHSSD